MAAALVPELYVSDLATSLAWYRQLGFTVRYAREEEGFAYLERVGAEIMLEEPRGRTFLLAPLVGPAGVGMNLQIDVADAATLFSRPPAGTRVVLPPETRTYRRRDDELTVRQFVVADPNGYLLRFSEQLQSDPLNPAPPPATP